MGHRAGECVAKHKGSGKKPVDKQKQAEKRARREERKIAEAKARATASRKKKIRTGLSVAAGVLVVGTAGFFIVQKAIPEELPGVETQTNNGRGHVTNNESVAYGTATPTSGSHSGRAPGCGILGQPLPPEFAVHALEHGVVVIWYQPSLETSVINDLTSMVRQYDDRVILAPNPSLTDPVVATAWTRLKTYSDADPEITSFIETYRNRGPESLRCAY